MTPFFQSYFENIKSKLYLNENNFINFNSKLNFLENNLTFQLFNQKELISHLNINFKYSKFLSSLLIDSKKKISSYISQTFFNNNLKINLFNIFNDNNYLNNKNVNIFNSNLLHSLSINYNHPSFYTFFNFGISKDYSISTLCSINSPYFSSTFQGYANELSSNVQASISLSNGLLLSIKGEISKLELKKVIFGYYNSIPNKEFHTLYNFKNSKIIFGCFLKTDNNIFFTSNSIYNLKTKEFKGEIGIDITLNSKFKAIINSDGIIKMETIFNPQEWINISFNTKTSLATSFNPILFGYSLDFKL